MKMLIYIVLECNDGERAWILHANENLEVDPDDIEDMVMEGSGEMVELDGEDPKVCFKMVEIHWWIVRIFSVRFWVANIESVDVLLYNTDSLLEVCLLVYSILIVCFIVEQTLTFFMRMQWDNLF